MNKTENSGSLTLLVFLMGMFLGLVIGRELHAEKRGAKKNCCECGDDYIDDEYADEEYLF